MARLKGVSRKAHNEKSPDYTERIRKGLQTKLDKKLKKKMSKKGKEEKAKKGKEAKKRNVESVADEEDVVDMDNPPPKKKRRTEGEDEGEDDTPVGLFEIKCDDGKFLNANTPIVGNYNQWTLRLKIGDDGKPKVKYPLTLSKYSAKNR
jgi:hypothetical protein